MTTRGRAEQLFEAGFERALAIAYVCTGDPATAARLAARSVAAVASRLGGGEDLPWALEAEVVARCLRRRGRLPGLAGPGARARALAALRAVGLTDEAAAAAVLEVSERELPRLRARAIPASGSAAAAVREAARLAPDLRERARAACLRGAALRRAARLGAAGAVLCGVVVLALAAAPGGRRPVVPSPGPQACDPALPVIPGYLPEGFEPTPRRIPGERRFVYPPSGPTRALWIEVGATAQPLGRPGRVGMFDLPGRGVITGGRELARVSFTLRGCRYLIGARGLGRSELERFASNLLLFADRSPSLHLSTRGAFAAWPVTSVPEVFDDCVPTRRPAAAALRFAYSQLGWRARPAAVRTEAPHAFVALSTPAGPHFALLRSVVGRSCWVLVSLYPRSGPPEVEVSGNRVVARLALRDGERAALRAFFGPLLATATLERGGRAVLRLAEPPIRPGGYLFVVSRRGRPVRAYAGPLSAPG